MLTPAFGLLALLFPQEPQTATPPAPGPWRATLESRGGPLPFGLDLEVRDGNYTATIINGPEQIPVPHVEWANGSLTIRIEPYESRITAKP